MGKQAFPVSGQRSFLGRLVSVVVVLGLIAWFIKSPTEAAATVTAVWNWFMGAVEAVSTFVDNVTG